MFNKNINKEINLLLGKVKNLEQVNEILTKKINILNRFTDDLIEYLNLSWKPIKSVEERFSGDMIVINYKFSKKNKKNGK
jgi:hypothetical protein